MRRNRPRLWTSRRASPRPPAMYVWCRSHRVDQVANTIFGQYYTRALSSPFGQKVKAFYTSTSKQVLDIHEEARRIAETQKAGAAAGSAPATASTAVGSAAPPIDPSVHSAATTADPTVAAGKTTEAPTVV